MVELEICMKGRRTDLTPWCKAKKQSHQLRKFATLCHRTCPVMWHRGPIRPDIWRLVWHSESPPSSSRLYSPHLEDEGDTPHQIEHFGKRESHACGCPWIPDATTTPWQKPALRASTLIITACIQQVLAMCWAWMGFPTVHPHRYL